MRKLVVLLVACVPLLLACGPVDVIQDTDGVLRWVLFHDCNDRIIGWQRFEEGSVVSEAWYDEAGDISRYVDARGEETTPPPELIANPHNNWGPAVFFRLLDAANDRIQTQPPRMEFIGDSITYAWHVDPGEFWSDWYMPYDGRPVWELLYEPRDAIRVAVPGNRTPQTLYQLEYGNLDPGTELIVLHIGTNNSGLGWMPELTAEAILTIMAKAMAIAPRADIILMEIFPRLEEETRALNDEVNDWLRDLGGGRVHVVSLEGGLTDATGDIRPEMFVDTVHLSTAGYWVWAEAVEPLVVEILETDPTRTSRIRFPPRLGRCEWRSGPHQSLTADH